MGVVVATFAVTTTEERDPREWDLPLASIHFDSAGIPSHAKVHINELAQPSSEVARPDRADLNRLLALHGRDAANGSDSRS